MIAIIVIIGLALGAFLLIGRKPARESGPTAESVTLDYGGALVFHVIPLTRNEATARQAAVGAVSMISGGGNGMRALHPEALRSLANSGELVGTVDRGTRAAVIERRTQSLRVKITSGGNTGLEGWVDAMFVAEAIGTQVPGQPSTQPEQTENRMTPKPDSIRVGMSVSELEAGFGRPGGHIYVDNGQKIDLGPIVCFEGNDLCETLSPGGMPAAILKRDLVNPVVVGYLYKVNGRWMEVEIVGGTVTRVSRTGLR